MPPLEKNPSSSLGQILAKPGPVIRASDLLWNDPAEEVLCFPLAAAP